MHTISFKHTNVHFTFQTNDLVVIFVDGNSKTSDICNVIDSLIKVVLLVVNNISNLNVWYVVLSNRVKEKETQFVVVLL